MTSNNLKDVNNKWLANGKKWEGRLNSGTKVWIVISLMGLIGSFLKLPISYFSALIVSALMLIVYQVIITIIHRRNVKKMLEDI